jgi:dynactin complex subunit
MQEVKLEPTDFNIADHTIKTAENMFNLMVQLANHIKKLEDENLELRERLANGAK